MWVEFVTPELIDSKIWPRMAAIAERLWSPQQVKDTASMYRRLAVTSRWLDYAGLQHRSRYPVMLDRLTNHKSIEPLWILDDILEPVKGYSREEAREYTSFTPLNRLVDATPAESNTAREFDAQVADWKSDKEQIRQQLTLWRDNQNALLPVMQDSALLEEDIPLAQDVSALAAAGLAALDYLESGKPAPATWIATQQALVDRASKPRAELLIMIAKPVGKLIEAAKQ
jgi:hexosaminidase